MPSTTQQSSALQIENLIGLSTFSGGLDGSLHLVNRGELITGPWSFSFRSEYYDFDFYEADESAVLNEDGTYTITISAPVGSAVIPANGSLRLDFTVSSASDAEISLAEVAFIDSPAVMMDDLAETQELDQDNLEPRNSKSIRQFRREYRKQIASMDGAGNNLEDSIFGASNTPMVRKSKAVYDDGESSPWNGSESNLPNTRLISNAIAAQETSTPNTMGLSNLFWQFGQFLDHDLVLTHTKDSELFPIAIPIGEPYFDPGMEADKTIPFERSDYIIDPEGVRQQVNSTTAFVDASMVYGSDKATARGLRAKDGSGKLLTSTGMNGEILLPKQTDPIHNNFMYQAGDIRANEQIGLTAMHTLFVREHNRIAEGISEILSREGRHNFPSEQKYDVRQIRKLYKESNMTADKFIYHSARRLVTAQIQTITYDEFLPLLIGKDALDPYTGYDDTVQPGISNEFATVAFRVGHTMLPSHLHRLEQDGQEEAISLRDSFFNPADISENGIDSLLRGMEATHAEQIDQFIIDDVRNFLFGMPGAGGFDLAALNLQRGRDHGIGSLNNLREGYELTPHESFDELTGNQSEQTQSFASVYNEVSDVDAWIGGLAEAHMPGAVVGETFQAVIADQFERLRDGDRFWHDNDPYLDIFTPIFSIDVTLSDIIRANTTFTDIDNTAFLASGSDPLG